MHFQMILRYWAKFQLIWLKATYLTNETAFVSWYYNYSWCVIHEGLQDGQSTSSKSPVFLSLTKNIFRPLANDIRGNKPLKRLHKHKVYLQWSIAVLVELNLPTKIRSWTGHEVEFCLVVRWLANHRLNFSYVSMSKIKLHCLPPFPQWTNAKRSG